jgi:hypothetical protein
MVVSALLTRLLLLLRRCRRGAVDRALFSVEPRLQQTISTAICFKSVPKSWLDACCCVALVGLVWQLLGANPKAVSESHNIETNTEFRRSR